MRPITPHSDPLVAKLLTAHDKVEHYSREFPRTVAELRAGGRTQEDAEELARKALKEQEPTEAERYDAIRAKVLMQQLAKREATVNPALDAMAWRPR